MFTLLARSLMLTFLLRITAAHILRLSCTDYANFTIVKENVVLQGSLLATFLDIAEADCEQQCILNERCKSINVEKVAKTCELNDRATTDFVDGEKILVPKYNWIYKATDHNEILIGEICQYLKPCGPTEICIDSCTCPGYNCIQGYNGCMAVMEAGYLANGVYKISNAGFPQKWLPVFCDMASDGGGWLVFQRRVDSSVDFNRGWNDYKNGFGELKGNYWLGLDKLHKLAAPGKGATLRVDITVTNGTVQEKFYATYSKFEIGDEASKFKLVVDGYAGNAEDALSLHNNMGFSTKDRDNDHNGWIHCAVFKAAGWWYHLSCHGNLNSPFTVPDPPVFLTRIDWIMLPRQPDQPMDVVSSEMKVKVPSPRRIF